MPKRTDIKKVLVIGSGPIVIGQAAEFDYAGTQACLALKEEGYEVILVNSNPATIMTDTSIADKVYMEPLTLEYVARICRYERPDAIVPGIGGQTGLNLAMQLQKKGVLQECEIELLGTDAESIECAEDRELFKELCERIGEPVVPSRITYSVEEGLEAAKEIGYPVILRPAFTLGGTGGGFAYDPEEMQQMMKNALALSPVHQVLVEKSIKGYKEIEYEVMRDANDTAITVCNMENLDPVGVHTGDSIVVAPSQTLTNKEYQMLRDSALKIIRALKVKGGCNVQFALDPQSFSYYVIEVNPRVSRSSALASKATGYPIARVSAKIAVGMDLDEIKLANTPACFEPALDYVVTKMPRFPFDKFTDASNVLSTQMKATGEVMGVGRTFEESLLKSIRSLEDHKNHIHMEKFDRENMSKEELLQYVQEGRDDRIYAIAQLMWMGADHSRLCNATQIDLFFLDKIKKIVDFEKELEGAPAGDETFLREAKKRGFSDAYIAELWKLKEEEVYDMRKKYGIFPIYKMIDTCASEFDSYVPYFYSTYESENESIVSDREKIVVLGSGPIRIGQGVEFDYSTVHAVRAIQEAGYEAIVINNNPETVSTDYTTADKLYFEPLTVEDVMNVMELEHPKGVIVSLGGQTAINLAKPLAEKGVPIIGTGCEAIDNAEDRDLFENMIQKTGIPHPQGIAVTDIESGVEAAAKVGYPVLVRPSYVLGGQGMQIAINDHDIDEFIGIINRIAQDHPILVDKYLQGKEIEVDAVCDGEDILIPGIMEHIERAGIHSGDSISVYPAQSISQKTKETIAEYTRRLAKSLHVIGLINIQFIVCGEDVYVIEVNPRSSRTVPYISKVTGIPIVPLATKVIIGHKIKELGYTPGLQPEADYFAIKMPVFSFEKIRGADISLGPEMKSTGECLGIAKTFDEALYKAFIGAGVKLPKHKNMIMTVRDEDKEEAVEIGRRFEKIGYKIFATEGTAKVLTDAGVKAMTVNKIEQESPNLMDLILGHKIDLVIDTPPQGADHSRDGFVIRRNAIETGVNVLTAIDTAKALITSLENTDIQKLTLIDIAKIK